MFNRERHAALTAVRNGEVTGTLLNAAGSPLLIEPRELTVDVKFLIKAGVVGAETLTTSKQRKTVRIFEVGGALT